MSELAQEGNKAGIKAAIESVLLFDGRDNYVELPPASIPSGNAITCSFWAWGGDGLPKANSVIEAWSANKQRVLNVHLIWDNSYIFFDCGNIGGNFDSYDRIMKPINVADCKGKWSHWAFTKDATAGEMKIYLNGSLWHQETGKTMPIPPTASARLGSSLHGQCYSGLLAEVQLWNRSLTQAEIQHNMQHRLVGNQPGLVSYWPLNEGEGKVVHDRTGNGNHGAIQGNASWVTSTLSIVDAAPSQPETKGVTSSPATQTQESSLTAVKINPAVHLPIGSQIKLRPWSSQIKLRSWKGDYLHRPDSPQGVTTWNTGKGNEWTVEAISANKIQLKSWKGDYLHRPDSEQGLTTWNTGEGNEWTVEAIAGNKVRLKSWKGDYLHRPDTAQGATTWIAGKGNDWEIELMADVLYFDGQANYIEIPHHSALGLTNNFTVEAWFNTKTLEGYQRIGSKFPGFGYGLIGSSLLFTTYWIQDYVASVQLTAGTWYHLAVVFDALDTAYFYLNGELVQTLDGELPATLAAGVLEIGRKADGRGEYFHGQLAEVRIWNKARTQAAIQASKSYRLVGDEPNLVGYWPMNEGVGTTVYDKSSNANHGTIHGEAVWGISTLEVGVAELNPDRAKIAEVMPQPIVPPVPAEAGEAVIAPGGNIPSQEGVTGLPKTPPAPIIIEMEPQTDQAVEEFFRQGNGHIYDSVDAALLQMKVQGSIPKNAVPIFIVISGSAVTTA